jgi:hypothetical protein
MGMNWIFTLQQEADLLKDFEWNWESGANASVEMIEKILEAETDIDFLLNLSSWELEILGASDLIYWGGKWTETSWQKN